MHLTIKLLQSLDGIIARSPDDKLDWGSVADKKLYKQTSQDYGVQIIGSRTFEQMPSFAFKGRKTVVLTRTPDILVHNLKPALKEFDIDALEPDPRKVVQHLESLGIEKALIGGGGLINSLFLKAGLVDEIIVTLAPRIFGAGTLGFGKEFLDVNLELQSFETLGENELLLTYKVQH
jgi:dihydrofolate reductase